MINRPIDEMMKYGGDTVDLAQGRTAAFFSRQKQQHESYGAPILYTETPVFYIPRSHPTELQKKIIMSEMTMIERRTRAATIREREKTEKGTHAPVVQDLGDLIAKQTAKVEEHIEPIPQKRMRKDFFGRVIQEQETDDKKSIVTETVVVKKESKGAVSKGPEIKYKYQEGFTNAVKRRLVVGDFT